ncbi:(2Fe-2S) ferredoxin domain-containing protein [Telmatospirillum sp.]|uniref:(2Fe-2S) ferredoxin domain-containing protein n=1 Tax=Telmatospirillum sp. TaxID=2079197 RepID=UPI00284B29E5|nr:(2Fe-2S) ferredoxin domain-containing protein [Telmatospirillum sp.]MDR3439599.1 (2Fe-2S) ferredoxin domain-containing protein [Telmatospirillum sp.]
MSNPNPSDPPPFYRLHVFICTNRRPEGHPRGSCGATGSERLRDYLKARVKELGLPGVRINSAGCLDRCELGPTMVIYPEGVWYGFRTSDDIDEILETHVVKGGRVDRLLLRPGDTPDSRRQSVV